MSRAGTIAAHLVGAGSRADPAKLFRYLVLAGQQALESAAVEDALRHLRRAEPLAGHAPRAEQAEMFFLRGTAERAAGRFGDAVVPWRRAIEIYEEVGYAEAVLCQSAAYSIAWAARFTEAFELAQRGLAALGDRVSRDRSRLLALSGGLVGLGGDYRAGMDGIATALAQAAELDDADADARAYTLFWKVMVNVVCMEMADAVELCEQGAEILRAEGELFQLAGTLGFLAETLVTVGRLADARKVNQEVAPLAERFGNAGALWHSVMVEGTLAFCEAADLDALEAIARREIALCEAAELGWGSWGWSWLALVAFLRGDWETAIDHAEHAESLAAPTPMWGLEWALHFEYRAYAGQRDQALAMLAARRAGFPRPGEPAGWGPWLMLTSAVEGLVVLGELEQAAPRAGGRHGRRRRLEMAGRRGPLHHRAPPSGADAPPARAGPHPALLRRHAPGPRRPRRP